MLNFNARGCDPLEFVTSYINIDEDRIQHEPRLKLASVSQAYEGDIARKVLKALRAKIPDRIFHKLKVETRKHKFTQAQFPPQGPDGWHTDFQQKAQQPWRVRHYLFVSGGPHLQFIHNNDVQVDLQSYKWSEVNAVINRRVDRGDLKTFYAPAGCILCYDATELHRSSQWLGGDGHWRYFLRASFYPTDVV